MSLPNINVLNPINGRQLKEDGTTANMANLLEAIQAKVAGNISIQTTGSITGTATAVSVGIATGLALPANANRKYASFQNDSDTTIYLMISGSAVLNQGIRLNPNGGSYEMSPATGNLDTRAVNAISSAAAKNLLVREGV